jgi:hypothetical protein
MVNMSVFMRGGGGHGVAQLVEALRSKPEGRGFVLDDVDSASDRNEYQEYFLVGKGSRCVSLTTFHFHVPIF